MARSGYIVAGGLVFAAFAAGLLIGRGGRLGPSLPGDSTPGSIARAENAGAAQSGDVRRSFEEVRAANAARPPVESLKGFAFARLRLDLSGEIPQACFDFSEQLDGSGETVYTDYVDFSPSVKVVAEVSGKAVCYSGFNYDTDYIATLKAGFPSAKGSKIEQEEEIAIGFGDRPAYAGFVGEGVILPRMEADGIGIETVNVTKLKVTVKRVGDRALTMKEITSGENVMEDNYGYAWDRESGSDVGVVVWEGDLPVENEVNQPVTTVFPLGAALGQLREKDPQNPGLAAGAYFVEIQDASEGAPDYSMARAWRWIVFTDMALTTYTGSDGMDVIVRSLETARPISEVELVLMAENNDILMRGKSDANGMVRFQGPLTQGEGALSPRMIMAYGPRNDFAVIDMQRSALDLSDRNVAGRYSNSVVDTFVWFDRGIYRPGETVHLSAMLRDQAASAVTGRGAKITFLRPNYTEAEVIRVTDMKVGGFTRDFEIPASAPRGGWTVKIEIDGIDEATFANFSVEDFVPQRIAVELDAEATPLLIGEERDIAVDVRYLYGAPGSGLDVEGEARLRVDPSPFKDYAGYQFGRTEERFDESLINLGNTQTDGEGKANLKLGIDPGVNSTGVPLRAEIVIGVAEPGGRFVNESMRIPVRADDFYIGVKRSDDDGGGNKPISFDVVILDSQGKEVEGRNLNWRLVEEDYRYEWYRSGSEWRWRRDYRDIPIATGSLTSRKSGPVKLTRTLDYGSYRLEVTDEESGIVTTNRFYSGWWSYASGSESPDQATLTPPSKPVTPGSQVKLTLDAPYAGEAVIVVATDRVQSVQRVKLEGRAREISITTDASWGAGFYVLATVVTPRDVVEQPVPRRAMGVAYVPFNMDNRLLKVDLDMPKLVHPRQELKVPVKIDGVDAGESVQMTIAAVDEGILRLTKFKSPDPVDWYFGKKALSVALHDDYGRLLNPNLGAASKFGGDQLGGEGLTVVPVKSVALFSGLVTVDANGKATVPINIPDFNGELRVMTVAWSKSRIGKEAEPLTVRDQVPALLSLPRFLAPGDAAKTTLLIDNVDGAGGNYQVTVKGDGPLTLDETRTVALKKSEKKSELFDLTAGETGIADVSLAVTGPGNFSVERSYPIQIRAAHFPVTATDTQLQASGASYTPVKDLLANYLPGSTEMKISWSPLEGVDPQSLLDSLYRYPYGCTEQLTSSAWPLLYVDKLGGLVGAGPERELRPRVQDAVNRILSRQSSDGAFGLWRAGDSYAEGWVGVYATDFLYRAKEAGYVVQQEALDRAYAALKEMSKSEGYISVNYQLRVERGSIWADSTEFMRRRAAAYAFYVLARQGQADLADLRYFHDNYMDKIPSPLARMHVASALAMMGDRSRAAKAFKSAMEVLGYENTGNYYQTPLRDTAAMLGIAVEMNNDTLVQQLTDDMKKRMKSESRLNTQEKAFILLAAAKLIDRAGPITILKGEEKLTGKLPSVMISPDELGQVSFRNDSKAGVFRTVSVYGVTKVAPPAEQQGFTLAKRIRGMKGEAVDLNNIRQNDRLIIYVTGRPQDYRHHPVVVVDMLPAGFEIESILNGEDSNDGGAYRWLPDLSRAKVSEARDDRFVAAVDVTAYNNKNDSGTFTFAYVVRAVTPGSFALPGAVVEDMYRPGVYARTAQGAVTIEAAN